MIITLVTGILLFNTSASSKARYVNTPSFSANTIKSAKLIDYAGYQIKYEPKMELIHTEITKYELKPVNIFTVDYYFKLLPKNVQDAFYNNGWSYEKANYPINVKFGYSQKILGLTIWAEKRIYIDNRDSANKAILHEVGHAMEYNINVSGPYCQTFRELWSLHKDEWQHNYGSDPANYSVLDEAYAECFEIYILKPSCLDADTLQFFKEEISKMQ